MDVNREIEMARRAQQERARSAEQRAIIRRRHEDAVKVEFEGIGGKFVQWIRLSGVRPNRIAQVPIPGATPTRIGRGRNKRYITPTREFWTQVFIEKRTTSERGFGEDVHIDTILAINQTGVVTWSESALGPRSVDVLMQHIVHFIVNSGSTTPWPT